MSQVVGPLGLIVGLVPPILGLRSRATGASAQPFSSQGFAKKSSLREPLFRLLNYFVNGGGCTKESGQISRAAASAPSPPQPPPGRAFSTISSF